MKAIAIINPTSGCCSCESLKSKLIDAFGEDLILILETNKYQNASELAEIAILKKPDLIIGCGGDGTISEIISKVMKTEIPIGIIPVGTGNLLAFNLGIPPCTKKAIKIIKKGYWLKTDIGKINGKIFTSLAGCGFDAYIVEKTTFEKKQNIGVFAYFWEALKWAFKSPYVKFKIIIDGSKTIKTKAVTVIIANKAHIFGEYLSIVPKKWHNDGKLDIITICPFTIWGYFNIFWKFIRGDECNQSKRLKYFQGEKIDIISRPKVYMQADGELIGKTPASIEIIKEAVKIIVPEKKHQVSRELLETTLRKIIYKAIKSIRRGG